METKLVRGKWVIEGSGSNARIIKDGAILIEGNLIRDVGEYEQIAKIYRHDCELGSDHHMVVPGLINAHHHGRGLGTFQAGVADGPLETWLQDLFRSYRTGIYLDTLYGAMNMIELGTTCVLCHQCERDPIEPTYRNEMERSLQAFLDSGMRVAFAPGIFDKNRYTYWEEDRWMSQLGEHTRRTVQPYGDNSSRLRQYFQTFEHLQEKYGGEEGRVRLQYGPWGPQWCSDELLQEIKKRANAHQLRIHLHFLETKYQYKHGFLAYGKSTVTHLRDIGFLGPDTSLAHCVWPSEEDIEVLSKTGAIPVHNPSSNLRIHSGISPVVPMIRSGMSVALGTDSTGLNDDDDMIQEMRLCWSMHRLPGLTSPYLDSSEVLEMATTAGARATGFFPELGAIEIGRKADLVLLDTRRMLSPFMSSRVPMLDALLQRAKASDIDTVLVDGKVIIKNGRFPHLDKDHIVQELMKTVAELEDKDVRLTEDLKESIKAFYADPSDDRGYSYNFLQKH